MAKEIQIIDKKTISVNENYKPKQVKITDKMFKKLFGFIRKVVDGLKTVPYVPGAIFQLAKLHKETEKKELKTESIPKTEDKENTMKTPEKSFAERVAEQVQKVVEKSDRKRKEAAKSKAKPIKTIEPKKINGVLNSKEEKENEPATPVEIPISKTDEESKVKKEKKNLKDLTVFDTYKDYKFAYFWNYKFNEYEADVLEKIANDLAKFADVNQFRTLLTEADFNKKKASQIKAKEISELTKAHKEELAQAEERRKTDVQAAIDERQEEVETLQRKLDDARSEKRIINSKLKVVTEALGGIQEKADLVGITAISDIIEQANKKVQGIDERAKEKAEEKETSTHEKSEEATHSQQEKVETQTDEIMKKINAKVYGQDAETNPKQAEESQHSASKEENSLMKELDSFGDSEIANPQIFRSTNPDYSGTVTLDREKGISANWDVSPITNASIFDNLATPEPAQKARTR